MANATPTGAIRPNHTTSDIRWVKESTVIKRLRRALAKKNHSLLITREGTAARRELGACAVLDSDGNPLQTHAKLAALGRFLGVLADDERVDPPIHRGWLHYVARVRTVHVDGIEARYHERLTRDYTTQEAARKAAERIADRANLALCGYDATIRESRHDA